MRLMLDTHTLIWFLNGDPKLSQKARHTIENPDNLKIVSIASIWEIAIKLSLNKFKFSKGFKSFLELIDNNGFTVLPITFEHALTVSKLEFIHRDPFDRLLISQCITDNLKIVSKDENIAKYDIETLW
ncbi:MAG: type II toxin-antitoxin system VapC family toxin [Bacteroidales bacterium]|nr:type II toxin-antitoxin system VapC family toxin [Bacteroidales bacterium]